MENNIKKIKYPYSPKGWNIEYVSLDNKFMSIAKDFSLKNSLDKTIPTASVIVKNNKVIGLGANGSDYHKIHECERVKNNIPTGQGYELCEGCHPKNHSEIRAIKNVVENNSDTSGADLYLWGHWWCCESCWNAIIDAGIDHVFLLENSEILFNKDAEGNIVGKQFST